MKIIRYSLRLLLSKIGFSLLIVVEITMLLTVANIAQAQHNSRTMLYDPIAPYIKKQGFICSLPFDEMGTGEDASANIDTLKTIPSAKVIEQKKYTSNGIDVIVVPDEMFDSLRLPVESGNLFKSTDSSKRIKLICTPNSKEYYQDMIFTDAQDHNFEISAVLTDPTYIPQFSYTLGMSYEDLYINYDSQYYEQLPYLFTCESMMKNGGIASSELSGGSIALVYFEERIPQDQYNDLKQKLNDLNISTIDNASIEKRSQKILNDDLKRSLPPIAAFSVIIVIGIISCSLMITKEMMYRLVIFYCCGATKKDCILISLSQMVLIMLCSMILSTFTLIIIKSTVLSNKIGFVLKANNIRITLLIVLGCLFISFLAPILLISKNEPRSLLVNSSEK